MPRMLLKLLVFVCVARFANSSEENDKSVVPKKQRSFANRFFLNPFRLFGITSKTRFFFALTAILLSVAGVVYSSYLPDPVTDMFRKLLDEYPAVSTYFSKIKNYNLGLEEFSPTFALLAIAAAATQKPLFVFILMVTIIFKGNYKGPWGFDDSLPAWSHTFQLYGGVSLKANGWSVISLISMLWVLAFKTEDHYGTDKRQNYAIENFKDANNDSKSKTVTLVEQSAGTTESPERTFSKTEKTEMKAEPTKETNRENEQKESNRTNVRKPFKPEPKKTDEETNWVAWAPIITAAVFVVGVVMGICYYKCCRQTTGSEFDFEQGQVAAEQNYETRQVTRNEFGQNF